MLKCKVWPIKTKERTLKYRRRARRQQWYNNSVEGSFKVEVVKYHILWTGQVKEELRSAVGFVNLEVTWSR